MSDFQKFITDEKLATIIETLKRSNDIFNIVKLGENQHSEVLKWLFDSREGHSQGDAIFKDFLTAAYDSTEEHIESNKQFFKIWTPSRIARTGFHSMFIEREFTLNGKRLDLLMIDTANKIIVAVENKHGAKLGKTQLLDYAKELEKIKNLSAFKGFSTALIVLDKHYDGNPSNEQWAFLDYSWLERGAKRAESQLKRGNQSASLVVAYCQKQSDYVPPDEEQIEDAFANLAKEFRPVIKRLYEVSQINVIDLEPTDLRSDQGDLWHFAKHYPEIVNRLMDQSTLTVLRTGLQKKYPLAQLNLHRTRLTLFDASWEKPMLDAAMYWPIYLSINEDNKDEYDNDRVLEQKYYACIYYAPEMVSDDYRETFTAAVKVEFPELKKGKQNVKFRCLGKFSGLSEDEIEKAAIQLYEKIDRAIKTLV